MKNAMTTAADESQLTEDTVTINSEDETVSNDDDKNDPRSRSRDLVSLVVPWVLLSLSAVAMAAHESNQRMADDPDYGMEEYHANHSARSLLPKIPHSHKPLHPLSTEDYIGFACATVGLIVAGGGGIGGGGILVPIYILVMKFSPKHAIPLANVTVLGGSVANTFLNSRKRHPLANRPLVDWDLILVMEPLTIGGALIGAFLNKMLPDELLVVMLVVLLSFTAKTTLEKAFSMYRQETKEMLHQHFLHESDLTRMVREDDDDEEDEGEPLLRSIDVEHDDLSHDGSHLTLEIDEQSVSGQTLLKILEEESHTPTGNILILLAMFVVVLSINIVKGGGAFPSPLGIKCGSNAFWISNIVMLAWIIIISLFVRNHLVKRHEIKRQIDYPYVEGDIEWDSRATIIYPVVCCLAGFFAGMFGVGGGIVKGPLMLAMGVHPAVSSASSACMILFTSFTATTSFVVFGLLIPDYAPVCFMMGFVATVFGQVGLYYLMQKFNRNSFIAFSIGAVVLLSAFLMTVQGLISLAEGTHHSTGGICGSGEE